MKKITLFFVMALVGFFAVAVVSSVSAQLKIPNPLAPGNVWDFPTLLTRIFRAIAGLVGTISVIMIIVAGILYLTSAGNPERMGKAKTALIYAIIGIVVAAASEAISATILLIIGAT